MINSWAIPIPILNENILEQAKRTDAEIELTIADVHGRVPLGRTNYSNVWQGKKFTVVYDGNKCRANCKDRRGEPVCPPRDLCPTGAFSLDRKDINTDKCFNCGTCYVVCLQRAFSAEMGSIGLKGKRIPVVLRQSDRPRALKLAEELKRMILDGEFLLTEAVERIRH